MIQDIPKSHPRYHSLQMRKKLSDAMKKGLVHETGLIAHGRGEAFDYMLGEQTIDSADQAEKVAAAALLLAKKPVISVNGNVVALVAEDCINLAKQVSALIEVNLFHRTKKRITGLVEEMRQYDDVNILGADASVRIPGLSHDRGWCEKDGIFSADVILVPLEDGDRCQALKKMGKTVITIDLNPLSRTAKTADITIVDNVIRALPRVISWVHQLKSENKIILNDLVEQWDNQKTLIDACQFMSQKLNQMD
jgi:4-phosphopantoate--beta-alanine ligase